MEEKSYKMQELTDQYLFAEDIVKAAIKIRTLKKDSALKIQLGTATFITRTRRGRLRQFFSKESIELDKDVQKRMSKDGASNYSNQQFLLCLSPFVREYNPEHESEEEFVLICSIISNVTAYFLKNNSHSDVIKLAVDLVYELLIDTFYPSMLIKGQSLLKDISDRKYRFASGLIKTLLGLIGISVPELELPKSKFTFNHKEKMKELFSKEWAALDGIIKSFTIGNRENDCSDETLAKCMDEILKQYGLSQNTDEEMLEVIARVAYVAAAFPTENRPNAMQLVVDRIHRMIKNTSQCRKYENDDDYRFSYDFVKEVYDMENNPLSVAEMSDCGKSFFIVADRNKIKDVLTNVESEVNEILEIIFKKSESSEYSISQLLTEIKQSTNIFEHEFTSSEKNLVRCCLIAYVAACLSRTGKASHAPGVAIECMLELIKDINCFTEAKQVLKMNTKDYHYGFAYSLVKSILEMMSVHVSDKYLPDSCNFLFTTAQINKIKKMFLKKRSHCEKSVKIGTDKLGIFDYNDGSFIQFMFLLLRDNIWHLKTEKDFIYVCIMIAYTSAFFLKRNINSNAPFLAVNRIYEMTKEKCSLKGLKSYQVLVSKTQNIHYRFAYDVLRTVLEIKEIPISVLDLPKLGDILFTNEHKNKIKMLLSNEKFVLDKIIRKLTCSGEVFDYSNNKFLHCMDKIVEHYEFDKYTGDGLLKIFSRIAYMAVRFLEKNCNSNATVLAVDHMYEMSKKTYHFSKKIKRYRVEELDYHFACDLVKAALEIGTKPSFKVETLHTAKSVSMNSLRKEIQTFLSKEGPILHEIVKEITDRNDTSDFSDERFQQCIHQVINNCSTEQKSESGPTLVFSRIAYVATCFVRKNINSNALDLAVDHICQMKRLFKFRNALNLHQTNDENIMKEKLFVGDVWNRKYRFAHDLVEAVMELQNTHVADEELPDPEKVLFTSQHRKRIKKLFRKQFTKIEQLIENLTNKEGNIDYSDHNFLHCMDEIFKNYEDELVTKNGFVCLCSRIAYPVSLFIRKNTNSNARTLAIERIYDMVKNTLHFKRSRRKKVAC